MKEIKFRFWNTRTNEYTFGYYMNNQGSIYEPFPYEDGRQLELVKTNYIIAEQYTGVKDNNGKEIYEGDIIEWNIPGYKEVIELISFLMGIDADDYHAFGPYFKVIGNIHENIELLEDNK